MLPASQLGKTDIFPIFPYCPEVVSIHPSTPKHPNENKTQEKAVKSGIKNPTTKQQKQTQNHKLKTKIKAIVIKDVSRRKF